MVSGKLEEMISFVVRGIRHVSKVFVLTATDTLVEILSFNLKKNCILLAEEAVVN
jgi:hypothetical protein